MGEFPYTFPFYFDDVHTALLDNQVGPTYTPYIKVALTKSGYDSYTFYSDSIKSIHLHQDPNNDYADISIDNSDQALTDVDLGDYEVVISLGLTIDEVDYAVAQPKQWVVSQIYESLEGVLVCTLHTFGIISIMRNEYASKEYSAGSTAKMLVDGIISTNISPYSHCTPFTVVWHGDTGLSGIKLYIPSNMYAIELNMSRLTAVQLLLGFSNSYMRPESDNKLHIRVPTISGSDYDFEFALDGHTFFWKVRSTPLITPNHVHVESSYMNEYGEGVEYEGDAYYSDSYDIMPISYFVKTGGLDSNSEADSLAAGVLANIVSAQYYGEVEVPINFYLQIGNYINIVDSREDSSQAGNVGGIDWFYEAGMYRQVITLGHFLGNKRPSFAQDYVPEEETITHKYWMTVGLPDMSRYSNHYGVDDKTEYELNTNYYDGTSESEYRASIVNKSYLDHLPDIGSAWGTGHVGVVGIPIDPTYHDGEISIRITTYGTTESGIETAARFYRSYVTFDISDYLGYPASGYFPLKEAWLRIIEFWALAMHWCEGLLDEKLVLQGVVLEPSDPLAVTDYSRSHFTGNFGELQLSDYIDGEDYTQFTFRLNEDGLEYLSNHILLGHETVTFGIRLKSDVDNDIGIYSGCFGDQEYTWGEVYLSFVNRSDGGYDAKRPYLHMTFAGNNNARFWEPGEDLGLDKYQVIQTILVPHYRRLYIGEYNAWSQYEGGTGGGHFIIINGDNVDDPGSWDILLTEEANTYYRGEPIPLFDCFEPGGSPVSIIFFNDSENELTKWNAYCAFDILYIGTDLP